MIKHLVVFIFFISSYSAIASYKKKFDKAICDETRKISCNDRAISLLDQNEKDEAENTLTFGCNKGSQYSCFTLAVLKYKNYLPTEALQILKKSCKKGFPPSCTFYSVYYLSENKEVYDSPELKMHKKRFYDSCKNGYQRACQLSQLQLRAY